MHWSQAKVIATRIFPPPTTPMLGTHKVTIKIYHILPKLSSSRETRLSIYLTGIFQRFRIILPQKGQKNGAHDRDRTGDLILTMDALLPAELRGPVKVV